MIIHYKISFRIFFNSSLLIFFFSLSSILIKGQFFLKYFSSNKFQCGEACCLNQLKSSTLSYLLFF
jgi:hypothetical protein